MDALLLIYNMILIIFYSITIMLAAILFKKDKDYIYLYISIVFGIYNLRAIILYFIDFIYSFAAFYKTIALQVCSLKTVLYAICLLCFLKILESLLHYSTPMWLYICFVGFTMYLLYLSSQRSSLIKLIFYCTPIFIFGLLVSLYSLNIYCRIPIKKRTRIQKYYRNVITITFIFTTFIIIEEILSYQYNGFCYSFDHRNFCEDLMSIALSILAINFFVREIEFPQEMSTNYIQDSIDSDIGFVADPISSETLSDESSSKKNILAKISIAKSAKQPASNINSLSKFLIFCRKYQLTQREQDIMTLLLDGKKNEEISENLHISVGTAKAHIHNIYYKLDIKKRRELFEIYQSFQS